MTTQPAGSELDQLFQELHDIKGFMTAHVQAGIDPLKEEIDRAIESLTKVQTQVATLERERMARMDVAGKIIVREGGLTGYDMFDLRILEKVLGSRIASDVPTSPQLMQDVQDARANLTKALTTDAILGWEERSAKLIESRSVHAAPLYKNQLSAWARPMTQMVHQRAMDSTTSGSGDELVPTLEAAELWRDVNLDTLVLPLLPQIVMSSSPFDMPLQFGDGNWYPVSENVQSLTTDLTTAKQTMTAYGLRTGVPFSDELEEDSVVAFIPELRRNLVRNAAEVIDDVLLNGDTTTTNNINADGVTIATNTAGKAHWLLGFNGMIHLPLLEANATQRNAHSATVTADMFNEIHAKIGKYGIARRPGELVYLADINTVIRSMSIPEVETVDLFGGRATISSGELNSVYGIPFIRSEQMALADTDGKVTDSGGNTVGRVLITNTSQWRVGFRRQITVETAREAGKGQTSMYVSLRIALEQQAASRGTATHTALQYDISGVA